MGRILLAVSLLISCAFCANAQERMQMKKGQAYLLLNTTACFSLQDIEALQTKAIKQGIHAAMNLRATYAKQDRCFVVIQGIGLLLSREKVVPLPQGPVGIFKFQIPSGVVYTLFDAEYIDNNAT